MSIDSASFEIIVIVTRPCAVNFFVVHGIGGCWWPISLRVNQSGTAALKPYNNATNSASGDYAMTCLMMEDKVSTVKFFNYSLDAVVK